MAKNIPGDVARIRKIVVYTKIPHHIRKYPFMYEKQRVTQWQGENALRDTVNASVIKIPSSIRLDVGSDMNKTQFKTWSAHTPAEL